MDISIRLARSVQTKAQSSTAFSLDVAFQGSPQGITVISGHSGAGKSTLIQCIAGLERPDAGHIVIGDVCLFRAAQGICIPPHKRRVGYVFQEARLFPHYSVRGNLCYGYKPQSTDYITFDDMVSLLGIGHLLYRKPETLSGGEAQRVALGRALLTNPRVLLMDEPLASLDQERRQKLMRFIKSINQQLALPIIYVSHAPDEVAFLAHVAITLQAGRVVG